MHEQRGGHVAPESSAVLGADAALLEAAAKPVVVVEWRINRHVTPAAQHFLLARQHVDDVQLVQLELAGAQFVADEINQQRKNRDVRREGQPGEHLFVDALEPDTVHRPDDDEIRREQQQQPDDRQLADLSAVEHRAVNAVDT